MNDAIGVNAFLYTVSKVALNTVMGIKSQDPGHVSRTAVKVYTKQKFAFPLLGRIEVVEIGQRQ